MTIDFKWITVAFFTLLILAALTAHASADITEITIWDGEHPIIDSLVTKTTAQAAITRADAVYKELGKLTLPYKFNEGNTVILIKKIAYDEKRGVYGAWVEATRDGKEVYTRSPVWVYNSPIVIEKSRVSTSATEITVTLKEDPLKAFERVFIDYVAGQPLGKAEGDDTVIVYATAAGSGDVDEDTDASWASMRGDTGDGSHIAPTRANLQIGATTTSDVWTYLYRVGLAFDTSSIGAGATVDSATLDVPGYGKSNSFTTAHAIALTGFSPATPGVLVTGDYDSFADTRLCDTDLAYASFDINDRYAYNLWALNTAGKSYVDVDGWTSLMLRMSGDVDNSVTWESGATTYYNVHITTAGKVPKLTIEYTPSGDSAPVAAFLANTTSGYPDFDIAFTDSSTNTPTSWEWLFGDGETSSEQSPIHTYDSWIGNTITKYTVNLTAVNAFGSDAENKTDYITAYPLNASFSYNVSSGCAPLHVGFTDATGNGTPSAWSWNFGGDGTASTQNATHVFTTPGTYWVSLNASNSYSWDNETKTGLITVNAGTVAAFSANATVGCPDLHVAFTDASGVGITNWTWDFTNDGNPDSYEQNPVAIYSTPGSYTVNLTVTGSCGTDSEVKTDYIMVSNNVVSAAFSADDTTVVTGQTVTFTDSSTGGPTTWAWSWGDLTANGTIQNPTHAYSAPGDYTVILTASNACGGSDVEEKVAYINVTAAPTPTPTPTPLPSAPAGSTGGKIPTQIYLVLIGAEVGTLLYTFKDLKNRLYGNIVSSLFAAIFAFALALFSGSGLIGEYTNLIASKAYNSTTGVTQYVYESPLTIQDLAMMFFWAFVGVTMALFTAYLIYEAYEERKQPMYAGEGKDE